MIREIFNGSTYNVFGILKTLLFNTNARFLFLIRYMNILNQEGKYVKAGFISRYLITRYGCYLGRKIKIGTGIKFPHPQGIIIGENTEIGNNCIIYQQVTFGGKNQGDAQNARYPKIGDNVIIYAGAKIIGSITVGNNAVIGANCVVNKNVPPDAIVGGVPATILKYRSQNN